jgi:hypothetical protein
MEEIINSLGKIVSHEGVTTGWVLDWRLDLLTTLTHDS